MVRAAQTDAIHAEQFVKCVAAKHVRLLSQSPPAPDVSPPDFEIGMRNGKILLLQATVADIAGRRTGAEHKAWEQQGVTVSAAPELDASELMELRRVAIPEALDAAVSNKLKKFYPPGTALFIDLNLPTHGHWQKEIETDIVEHTWRAGEKYSSVWVWWGGRLYRTWPSHRLYELD